MKRTRSYELRPRAPKKQKLVPVEVYELDPQTMSVVFPYVSDYLNLHGLCSLSMVCKTMTNAMAKSDSWQRILSSNDIAPPKKRARIYKTCQDILLQPKIRSKFCTTCFLRCATKYKRCEICNLEKKWLGKKKHDDMYDDVYQLYSAQKYRQAIQAGELFLSRVPTYAKCWNLLGASYYNLKSYDEAIKIFNKCVETDERYQNPYYNRGVAFYALGNYELALRDLNKALEINPKYERALNWKQKTEHSLKIELKLQFKRNHNLP